MALQLRVRRVEFFVHECRTRIPFKFGATTFTGAPLCVVRLVADTEAGEATGYASDFLVPKWFDKDPTRSPFKNIRDLTRSCFDAAEFARQAGPAASAFDLWLPMDRAQRAGSDALLDGLVRGFGVSMVERALLDALCRVAGISFHEALRQDLFGFRPGMVEAELDDFTMAESLTGTAMDSVAVRHTVGLADPLHDQDRQGPCLDDGLPETLQEDIRRYDLHCFKLKLCGKLEDDVTRLQQIGEVLQAEVKGRLLLSVDGNEQFRTMDQVHETLRRLQGSSVGNYLLDGLAFIEQPLARAITFDSERLEALPRVTEEFAPVIIDEADAGLESFGQALACGYRGISVKNCKGVFKALVHHAMCCRSPQPIFQSSEDLSNLGVLSLQQDLATLAAVGLTHSERNGHHYFCGLQHLPPAESEAALNRHPDLYEDSPLGPQLKIQEGRLRFGSIHQVAGFGHDITPDFTARQVLRLEDFQDPLTDA